MLKEPVEALLIPETVVQLLFRLLGVWFNAHHMRLAVKYPIGALSFCFDVGPYLCTNSRSCHLDPGHFAWCSHYILKNTLTKLRLPKRALK